MQGKGEAKIVCLWAFPAFCSDIFSVNTLYHQHQFLPGKGGICLFHQAGAVQNCLSPVHVVDHQSAVLHIAMLSCSCNDGSER